MMVEYILIVKLLLTGIDTQLFKTPMMFNDCRQKAISLNIREKKKHTVKRYYFCAPVVPS